MATHTLSREVTDEQFNRIIQIESAGEPDARPPKGSAAGLGQFLVGTWNDVGKKHYPRQRAHYGSKWDGMRLGEKTATIQLLMLARFTEDNVRALGRGWTDGDLYLAHFLGISDARKVFRAAPNTPMSSIVKPKVIENNPFMRGKTAEWLRSWAQSSMVNRWKKAGQPDHVSKWWNDDAAARFLSIGGVTVQDDDEFVPVKMDLDDDARDESPPAQSTLPGVRGDPDVWLVQSMLKGMNYPPGGLDGRWGGMTAGAIAEFLNDWDEQNGDITPPKSAVDFEDVKDVLKEELAAAKTQHFKRPVSAERANADEEKVQEIAPETAPVQRNSQIGFWGTISAMVAAAWNAVSEKLGDLWSFFIDNEDKISGAPNWLWSTLASVPTYFWFLLIAGVCGFVWYNSRSAVTKIVSDIKTGVRK